MTAVENKIPDTSNLVKKTEYNTKVTEIEKKLTDHSHNKYITTTEFNKLATDAINARLVQADLVKYTDFDNKLSDLHSKIVSNKMKDISIAKVIFMVKITSMKMVIKIITYFSQFLNI